MGSGIGALTGGTAEAPLASTMPSPQGDGTGCDQEAGPVWTRVLPGPWSWTSSRRTGDDCRLVQSHPTMASHGVLSRHQGSTQQALAKLKARDLENPVPLPESWPRVLRPRERSPTQDGGVLLWGSAGAVWPWWWQDQGGS